MSIDNVADLPTRVQYTASAGQDEFAYPFPIFQDADLVVYVDDEEKTLSDDYTVSGATDDTGGYVTLTEPLAGGEIVTIYRETVIERTSDFPQNGPWFSDATNDDFDRLTIIAQELRQAIRRCLRLPMVQTAADGDTELPASTFAGRYLAFDANGKPTPAALSETAMTQAIVLQLLASDTDAAAESLADIHGNAVTAAEVAAEAVIVDFRFPPGHPYRYGRNTTPGTTDMTAAINMAADVCREGGYKLRLPAEEMLVSSTLDFDLIRVEGETADMAPTIRASSAQFHVIRIRQSASCANFRVHGGWDGSTAGQTGDIFHIENDAGTGFAYNIHLANITATHAKQRLVYWHKGGYGSIYNFHGLAAGLHGLELWGSGAAEFTTTIAVGGQSTFGSTPNGYGIKLTDCASISIRDTILEDTAGILVDGGDNRSISFDNVYQENFTLPVGNFITFGTSGGVGLSITNCFGGNKSVEYPTNWQNVYFGGNSNLGESAIPFPNRIVQCLGASNTGAQSTTTTTGGVSVTAASVSLPPGTWQIDATLQTAPSSGTPNLSDAGIVITTNASDAGASSSTSSLVEGADRTYAAIINSSVRLSARRTYQNTSTAAVTVYLRAFFNISAGTLAYNSVLTATRLS